MQASENVLFARQHQTTEIRSRLKYIRTKREKFSERFFMSAVCDQLKCFSQETNSTFFCQGWKFASRDAFGFQESNRFEVAVRHQQKKKKRRKEVEQK